MNTQELKNIKIRINTIKNDMIEFFKETGYFNPLANKFSMKVASNSSLIYSEKAMKNNKSYINVDKFINNIKNNSIRDYFSTSSMNNTDFDKNLIINNNNYFGLIGDNLKSRLTSFQNILYLDENNEYLYLFYNISPIFSVSGNGNDIIRNKEIFEFYFSFDKFDTGTSLDIENIKSKNFYINGSLELLDIPTFTININSFSYWRDNLSFQLYVFKINKFNSSDELLNDFNNSTNIIFNPEIFLYHILNNISIDSSKFNDIMSPLDFIKYSFNSDKIKNNIYYNININKDDNFDDVKLNDNIIYFCNKNRIFNRLIIKLFKDKSDELVKLLNRKNNPKSPYIFEQYEEFKWDPDYGYSRPKEYECFWSNDLISLEIKTDVIQKLLKNTAAKDEKDFLDFFYTKYLFSIDKKIPLTDKEIIKIKKMTLKKKNTITNGTLEFYKEYGLDYNELDLNRIMQEAGISSYYKYIKNKKIDEKFNKLIWRSMDAAFLYFNAMTDEEIDNNSDLFAYFIFKSYVPCNSNYHKNLDLPLEYFDNKYAIDKLLISFANCFDGCPNAKVKNRLMRAKEEFNNGDNTISGLLATSLYQSQNPIIRKHFMDFTL